MPIDDTEPERRRRLMSVHVEAENARDLTAIMARFADNTENRFDSTVFVGRDEIAQGHVSIGMSDATPGALENLRVVVDQEYFNEVRNHRPWATPR